MGTVLALHQAHATVGELDVGQLEIVKFFRARIAHAQQQKHPEGLKVYLGGEQQRAQLGDEIAESTLEEGAVRGRGQQVLHRLRPAQHVLRELRLEHLHGQQPRVRRRPRQVRRLVPPALPGINPTGRQLPAPGKPGLERPDGITSRVPQRDPLRVGELVQ
ncbi:hypothetical protein ACWY4P_35920 [Streptomyces sp. LZ34]